MKFIVYRDGAGDHRWRLFGDDARVVADSGEGYRRKTDCIHDIQLVQDQARKAPVEDHTTGAGVAGR
jgi:uncharacterized protein YegP (UPF0339 family)